MKKLLALLMLVTFPVFASGFITVQKTDGTTTLRNTKDGFDAFVLQPQGAQGVPYVSLFDDFVTSSLDTSKWSAISGTTAVPAAIYVSSGGVISMTTGTAATTASGQAQITGQQVFIPSKGGLSMETSIAESAITSQTVFIGFTDSTSLELPVSATTTISVANADNAVGFIYSTSATSLQWQGVGVKDTVTTTLVPTGVTPTTGYQILRVDVDSSGNADFWVNNVWKKHIQNAVSSTAALNPVIAIQPTGANRKTLYSDYIKAGQKR